MLHLLRNVRWRSVVDQLRNPKSTVRTVLIIGLLLAGIVVPVVIIFVLAMAVFTDQFGLVEHAVEHGLSAVATVAIVSALAFALARDTAFGPRLTSVARECALAFFATTIFVGVGVLVARVLSSPIAANTAWFAWIARWSFLAMSFGAMLALFSGLFPALGLAWEVVWDPKLFRQAKRSTDHQE